MKRIGDSEEAARYFVFVLRQAHGTLADVVGELYSRFTFEVQDCIGMAAEEAQQIGRD
jgi:hypothetical protein